MRLVINNTEVNIPSDLSEITLGQRIRFQEKCGNLLDEIHKSIMAISDETEREIELVHYQFLVMVHSMSFFMDTTIEAIQNSIFIDQITHIYYSCLSIVFQQESQELSKPKESFIWKGEEWVLDPPVLKNGDRMTFGEFIDSKQIVQDLFRLGKNKWEALIPLSAIFLRKLNEAYDESFLYEGSDRLKLMEELPMDIAIHVAFFLSNSVSMYTKPFQSLHQVE